MFGMLWIGVFDRVFKVLPICRNFAQPWKRTGQNQQPFFSGGRGVSPDLPIR